ncbi:MAG: hypothetical protein KDC92_07070, partial [Bacteroidetes bacterium]|nr:hypothetical protein [Bacteroidota bacterium]
RVKLEGISHGHNQEMYVQAREPELLHYKCSECHNQPITQLRLESKAEGKLAHWDTELHHAGNAVMNCFSCHNEQDFNSLKTLGGKKISFNHSYNLCGQCHSTQLKDWIGGAHGKRLGGWTKPRVSASCTNCHNPHNPSIKSRWPARLNTQKVLETQKPEIGE